MTNIAPIMPPSLDGVLAKDRHAIRRLYTSLKRLPNTKDMARYEALITRSQENYKQRQQAVPAHLAETLNAELPVSAMADEIVSLIRQHQVVIIAGETGSGKTTQLPKLALLAGQGVAGQIGHTQPRRIAARSVATRISEELGETLGQTVSYKVRFTEEGGKHSLIKLMTDGILLNEMGKDPYLTAYDTIIIDEAHERSLNIDFIMGYLKQLLVKRADLKVIITSATLDTERFADYFTLKGKRPPVCIVQGRSYPVEIRYRPLLDEGVLGSDDDRFDDVEERLPRALIEAVNECIFDSNQKGVLGDILVFCATESEINELSEVLINYAPAHTEILTLFARQSILEQNRIFSTGKGRRIILATNVAETALTVPNIRYVIDLGFARISRYNYRSRVQRLPIEAISQAAANQRAGRCGRLSDGVCIRLYSEEDFNARPRYTEPEILRTNLASVILQMAYLNLGEVAEFDFITPPDFRLINDGKKLLFELGAIDDKPTKTAQKRQRNAKAHLTTIGRQMAKMPIDPRLARMLIASTAFDCLADMLIIVSALSVQDIKERPSDKQAQADQKHALFRAADSDFLFYLNAFKALFGAHTLNDFKPLSSNARKQFAKAHYLSYPRIREWQKTHSQLCELMKNLGYDTTKLPSVFELDGLAPPNGTKTLKNQSKSPAPSADNESSTNADLIHYANIHRSLLTALLSFVAKKTEVKGEYQMAKNHKGRIFPASTLHKKGVEWLMAFEVVETSQVYLRINAKIDPAWILAAAGDLFKYHYYEPHWSKKTGKVRAYAQISLFGLVVVAKVLVDFEKIDPSQSREIFIMDALVANNLGAPTAFLTHNQAKIDKIAEHEDKLRRRDLLVDETVLYEFYDKKLPATVVSKKSLLAYLSDPSIEKTLFVEDKDIAKEMTDVAKFPSHWQMGALKLPLSYVFDPSSDEDGVSVKVPVLALSQLSAVDLLWGILPWRFDLVVALLKSLPKEQRRALVPIPDTAKKLIGHLDHSKKLGEHKMGLLDQLCALLVGFGVKVTVSDFELSQIDEHLKPLVCVVNEKGQIIDKSRDVQKLQQKHKSSTEPLEDRGTHQAFPEHFHFVALRNIAKVAVQEFCALQPNKARTAVNILAINDIHQALSIHKEGVLTLIKLSLSAQQKQLGSQIDKALKMAFAPLGDLERLKTLLIDASLSYAFDVYHQPFKLEANNTTRERVIEQNQLTDERRTLFMKLPLTTEEFEQVKKSVIAHFLQAGQTMLALFRDIYISWQTVRGQLLMLDQERFSENISDIEDQLDDLALADFVYKVDSKYWLDYPRYLSALKIRLERLPNNLQADTEAVYLLDEPMERLSRVRHDPMYAPYRWLLEEYRINLFAQPMKTKSAVSEKRLEKLWASLNTR